MSVLTVIQDAAALCGFARPNTVMGSNDGTTALFAALLQQEVDELRDYARWRSLKVQAELTGTGTDAFYVLPPDFDRFADGQVFFLSQLWGQYLGQVTSEEFTAIRARGSDFGYRFPVWRLFGNMIEFSSPIQAGDKLSFEYQSDLAVSSADYSERKVRWTADSDIFLLPEQVLTLGLVWRFKNAKKLDYGEDFRSYQMRRDAYAFKDAPRQPISGRSHRSKFRDTQLAYPWPLGNP